MKRVQIRARARCLFLPLLAFVAVHSAPPSWVAYANSSLLPSDLLDRPVMSLSAADLQRAAMSLPAPEGEGLITIARQASYHFDSQGRATTSWRGVVRILTATGARSFGPLEPEWSPWHEERPQIHARVITRDGKTYVLDPRTITEQPVSSEDPEQHSDRRALKVPLPALQPGSVLEYEIVLVQKAPAFEKGSVWRQYFTASSATGLIRLILEAPRSLPLRYAVHDVDLTPRRSETPTTTRLVFERGPLLAKSADGKLPPGMAPLPPRVEFSTGESWKQVASSYSAAVDARLRGGPKAGLAQQIAGTARNHKEIVQRLLRYLRSEVRYTAVELGESELLPRSPAETLGRKYGDCKDQATLLVSLLRSLGIPAYVALLRTGVRADVDRNLPGLGLFDHAIVYVPASAQRGRADEPALWVDPTLEFGQPDELPFDEQGRLALVASPGTTGLLTTPVLDAMRNRIRETREVHLAEYGPARIVETTEAWGSADRDLRRQVRKLLDEGNLEKRFKSYAQATYNAKGEVHTQTNPPEDLEAPFRLRIEAAQASRGTTELVNAAVAIPIGALLDGLPEDLLDNADEADSSEQKSGVSPQPYRFEPLVREWHYHIIAPSGFQSAALPRGEVLTLGPGHLTKTFRVEPGNAVSVDLRFDSGNGSLSLSSYHAMRRALSALRESDMLLIKFDQIAERHLAAGRFREAYSEFRRLVALHPGEALHRAQLTYALMEGGLGESARQLAEEAVALEPQSAAVHRLRASVLMSDLSGQFLSPGWDRAGAIAELRRALSLNPEDRQARLNLAFCLERNAAGRVHGGGADLDAAITEWRTLIKRDPKLDYYEKLVATLLWAGRNAELDAAVAAIPKGELHNAALIVSTAANRGGAAAIAAARNQLSGSAEQRTALVKAAETFIGIRNYALAGVLFDEAANDAQNAKELRGRADVLRHLRRYEESATLSHPTDPLLQYMARIVLDDAQGAPGLRALFGPQMASFLSSEAFAALRHHLRASTRATFPSPGCEADIFTTFAFPKAEGNEQAGFRVETGTTVDDQKLVLFVTRQKGGFRIIGQNDSLSGLGYEALYHLDRGELAEAQQLLKWARLSFSSNEDTRPFYYEPFTALWQPDEPLDADKLRIAAAALSCSLRKEPACSEPQRSRAIEILTEARDRFNGEAPYELALASVFERIGRYEDALAAVARLRLHGLLTPAAEALEVVMLHESGRTAIARIRLESMLRAAPQSGPYYRLLAQLSEESGDFINAEFCWRKIKELGAPEATVLSNLSWLAVLTAKVSAATEADARRAVELTKRNDPQALRILAATLLENGKPSEALEILRQISDTNEGELAPADQYLVGRLAEHYGERQAAIAAYRRIPGDTGSENRLASLHWLAQKRMADLMQISRNQ